MKSESTVSCSLASLGRRDEAVRIFLICFVVNVFARGQALFGSLLSIDGYFVAKINYDDEVAYSLRDGRFLRALLWRLQEALGFSPLASESASLALATVALLVAAMLFADALATGFDRTRTIVFILLFSLHPFLTEYFYYGEASLGIAVSVLLAAISVWLTADDRISRASTVWSAAAVFAALSTYQVAIGFMLAGLLLMTARADGRIFGRVVPQRIVALVGGCAAYGLSLFVLRALRPVVAGGRVFNLGDTSVSDRLRSLGEAVLRTLAPQDGLVATPVAVVSGILASCGLLALGIRAWRKQSPVAGTISGSLALLALVLSCASAVLPRTPWLAPRLLSPCALVFASLTVACLPVQNIWRRRIWMVCSAIIILGYFSADASILFDQRRVNLWDHQLANRIAARLENQPGFADVKRLAVIGVLPPHPFPLATADHDLNASAFSASWSKFGVIEQATGLRFDRASNSEMDSARAYCAQRNVWPDEASTANLSGLAVVCLSKP